MEATDRTRALAAAGVGLGLAAMAIDHLVGDDPGLEDPVTFAISAAIVLGLAALLFLRVVPRSATPARSAVIVATVAVLSLPFVWLGPPFVLGPAAMALGLRARGRAANAATVVGAGVLVLATAASVYSAVEKLA